MNLLLFLMFVKAIFNTNPFFVSDNWEEEYMNNLANNFIKTGEEVFDKLGG